MSPVAPFGDIEVCRAVAMTLDRKAFNRHPDTGQGDVGGAIQPGPEGQWGPPPDELQQLPGYHPDVAAAREKRAPSSASSATARRR